MSGGKKCSFNADWANPSVSDYVSWIRPVENDPHEAMCTVCRKTFSLSNMGHRAVSSHASSKKHIAALNLLKSASQPKLLSFFKSPTDASPSSSAGSAAAATEVAVTTAPVQVPVGGFLLKNNVTKAEIIWCLNTIMTHGSFRSAAASSALFPLTFPTSEVAAKVQLGKDKVGYTICHGIAPYFHNMFLSSLVSVPYLAVCFDEALNKVTEQQQMDVLIRHWDAADDRVRTRYLTSCFLGHTCAEDLASSFRKAVQEIKGAKILQVSMDGPNVNFKFLRSLKEELRESDDILFIGSCGLHVINGAYKAGHVASGWDLVSFLRSAYNLFKCVPARRADFASLTGCSKFPMKFCAVRWLENSTVICRALEILPHLIVFVQQCKEKAHKRPTCSSYKVVEEAVSDELLSAKLAFALSIAEELEPFLREFQADKPMIPFLSAALESILRSLLSRIVKREVLDAADTIAKLMKIDVSIPENAVNVAAFDLGFSTKNELRKNKKLSQLAIMNFKKCCISFVKACAEKVVERFKYKLAVGAGCLDPACALSLEAAYAGT
ncbi:hypothetical protein HPB50_016336 [Hyalomma asiaticum]|uniref:Uncharacterized protein n=1 Tax=Hyalomma asiaticum TaxID=266040 RepID=A0ACB7SLM9_HYAAI|nr:hypothetical protein HPB50_016336 [Hyalomma asiaticum]